MLNREICQQCVIKHTTLKYYKKWGLWREAHWSRFQILCPGHVIPQPTTEVPSLCRYFLEQQLSETCQC